MLLERADAALLTLVDDAMVAKTVPSKLQSYFAAGIPVVVGAGGAVERLAARVRQLGRLARRPQSGQLHHYYVQAVAVLAVGVLLLLTVR